MDSHTVWSKLRRCERLEREAKSERRQLHAMLIAWGRANGYLRTPTVDEFRRTMLGREHGRFDRVA